LKFYRTTLFPKLSPKTFGITAIRNLATLSRYNDGLPVETPIDLEQVYHQSGFRGSGPVEMRSVWRYNDLKPRAYFGIGPDHTPIGVYIQAIYNIIIDSLPNVHTFTRFATTSLKMTNEDLLFIYDYSSFTSTLHEIQNFTARLADFYRHTFVTVVDSYYGPVSRSVGDLLDEYNQTSNISPEFDVSQILQIEDMILNHNCGMLGVPGNITSCTLLHGIHLAIIVGALMKNKVVGDDAIGSFLPRDGFEKIDMIECLQNIGRVSAEKSEWWTKEDERYEFHQTVGNYIKRPLNRFENHAVVGDMIIWPSIACGFGLEDGYHVPFPTLAVRQQIYSKQLLRMYDQMTEQLPAILVEYQTFLYVFNFPIFRALGLWNDRTRDSYRTMDSLVVIPPMKYMRRAEIMERLSGTIVYIPVYEETRNEDVISIAGVHGDNFVSRSKPILTYLRKLRYIESKMLRRLVVCDEVSYDDLICYNRTIKYEHVVTRSIPVWLLKLLNSLPVDAHFYDPDDDDDMLGNLYDTDADSAIST
jgi:hypothetical protein